MPSPYYDKHLFFCVNQRDGGRQCCANKHAQALREYAKNRLNMLDLSKVGNVRVNQSGCLGRCSEGPVLVIYPEGIWYTYANEQDIDEIIDHILKQKVVERLLLNRRVD
jgi:(2Fe-2S) ferredoxin